MAECIHGFENGLCDSCFPKAAPVKPVVARVVQPRTSSGGRAGKQPPRPTFVVADQRVYHVTHVSNLEAIVDAGELNATATPVVDVSSDLTHELRSTAEFAANQRVSDHVSFYLSPQATVWDSLREGAVDPRWSDAARAAAVSDIVVLVSNFGALGTPVVTDGDAAGSVTRFATDPGSVDRLLRTLYGTEQARDAEVLAPEPIPFEAIQLVGVANEPMRERVREIVGSTKIVVYPPWFQPTPAS